MDADVAEADVNYSSKLYHQVNEMICWVERQKKKKFIQDHQNYITTISKLYHQVNEMMRWADKDGDGKV